MCAGNELDQILHIMADAYRSVYGDDVYRIILYGSYARGDNTSDSDVDIVAIVHGSREYLQERLKEIWDRSADLELQYETIISPTVIPYEEFKKYRNDIPYYRNIEQEGVEISA